VIGTGLPNPNFRNQGFFIKNQELIRRFFSQKSGEKSGSFSKESETIRRFCQKIWRNIRQFSLGKAKLSLLQTLVACLYQASNGNNCLTSEIKERKVTMNVSKSWK
jgi:hypothetical protein